MKAVFVHKPNSPWNDKKGIQYHFPKQYLNRVSQALGDYIVYYEQFPNLSGRYYTSVARLKSIQPDPENENNHYAFLDEFIDFDRRVGYREDGGFERKLVQVDGSINGGHAQNAVRLISNDEFAKIIEAGLSTSDEWPDRVDQDVDRGFEEGFQASYEAEAFERPIVSLVSNRKWRDKKFRQNIRRAYDRTCAFTGLRLINGKGRPEIEAAHIVPVENGGNDWIRNGIALSGTVHWMFDRGMLSLADDFTILQSRQNNHDVTHLLNADLKAKVPEDINLQPHPDYLRWHRENKFKL
ncbi:MAG: HNH endonuclease [Pseudomonadota bacterium]